MDFNNFTHSFFHTTSNCSPGVSDCASDVSCRISDMPADSSHSIPYSSADLSTSVSNVVDTITDPIPEASTNSRFRILQANAEKKQSEENYRDFHVGAEKKKDRRHVKNDE